MTSNSSNELAFINSINRIVNIDINNTAINKQTHPDDYFDLNNISSTNDDNSSSNNTFSKEESNDENENECLNDEITNRIADLTELDNLLDDLYNAKKNLAASNSINHNINYQNSMNNVIEIPTLNRMNNKQKILSDSLNNSTRTSTSSSSPTSLKSNLNQFVSSCSSTTSSSLSSNQFLNTNISNSNSHNISSSPYNSYNYSIEKKIFDKEKEPSISPTLLTTSSLNDNSRNNIILKNTRHSLERLVNTIKEKNMLINKPNVSVDSHNAAKELETLITSLSMYKNEENEEKTDSDVKNIKSLYRTDSNNSSVNSKLDNKPINSLIIKYDGRKTLDRNYSLDINIDNSKQISLEKNSCAGCNKPIVGQVITALGYLWHPEHFVCFNCKISIGTNIFYEKENKPYCEKDYIELFSPKCAACTKPILDKMLTALNKSWHIQCFQCNSCHKNLNDESFLEINDFAYCKNCYINELAPKCKRCNKAIIENFISALDSYWHPNCFVCVECGSGFNSSSFYEYLNMPYCEVHYHLKRGSLCSACQQPINGRCISALNKKYHPEHFNCSFCLKELNKGTFKEQNEKPYCNSCFIKLFP